jgi:uncharacterized membrane protein YedE/YeeE
MTIDWIHFTPSSALIGGCVIGLATAIFLLFNGRIAGISGIVGGLFHLKKGNIGWRMAFLIGLVISPIVYGLASPLPLVSVDASYLQLIIGGLLVGLGTRYGSGCTSGHGVCGLARRSPRSLVATAAFMATGFFTVFLIRHVLS